MVAPKDEYTGVDFVEDVCGVARRLKKSGRIFNTVCAGINVADNECDGLDAATRAQLVKTLDAIATLALMLPS